MFRRSPGRARFAAAVESANVGDSDCIDVGNPFPFAFAINHSLPESVGRVLELILCDTYTFEAVGVRLL